MTNKEITFFAIATNIIILLMFLPLILSDMGYASISARAFTADENDTVYLVANRKIRVISSDGTVITFRSPLTFVDAVDTNEQSIRVFSGQSYAVLDKSGTVIEQGISAERETANTKDPVLRGNSVYRYRSVLGFYRITKETDGETVVRYQMPAADMVLRIVSIIGGLLFVPLCAGVPIYFLVQNRIAKDGTILSPKTQKVG